MLKIRQMLLIFICAIFVSTAAYAESNGIWRLDGWNLAKVSNFRITSKTTSASAQLSEKGFSLLYDVLRKESFADTEIYIVDLRQESHGFANGMPVSWYKEHNQANAGKSAVEVEKDEAARLNAIMHKIVEFKPLGKHDEATLNKLTIRVDTVQTEHVLAEQTGFKYVRFAAADMMFPAPEVVDEFIKFYMQLPQKHHLHFHCHAGHGRTTIFLVFYDILTYPDLTLDEIVKRQYDLGGSNLLADEDNKADDWYTQNRRDRAKKIRRFYEYVQEQRDNKFKLSWSDYLQSVDELESESETSKSDLQAEVQ